MDDGEMAFSHERNAIDMRTARSAMTAQDRRLARERNRTRTQAAMTGTGKRGTGDIVRQAGRGR